MILMNNRKMTLYDRTLGEQLKKLYNDPVFNLEVFLKKDAMKAFEDIDKCLLLIERDEYEYFGDLADEIYKRIFNRTYMTSNRFMDLILMREIVIMLKMFKKCTNMNIFTAFEMKTEEFIDEISNFSELYPLTDGITDIYDYLRMIAKKNEIEEIIIGKNKFTLEDLIINMQKQYDIETNHKMEYYEVSCETIIQLTTDEDDMDVITGLFNLRLSHIILLNSDEGSEGILKKIKMEFVKLAKSKLRYDAFIDKGMIKNYRVNVDISKNNVWFQSNMSPFKYDSDDSYTYIRFQGKNFYFYMYDEELMTFNSNCGGLYKIDLDKMDEYYHQLYMYEPSEELESKEQALERINEDLNKNNLRLNENIDKMVKKINDLESDKEMLMDENKKLKESWCNIV